MTIPPPDPTTPQQTADELRALRDEISALRRDLGTVLAALRELFSEIRRVEDTEDIIERDLELVAERLGDELDSREPSLTSCEVCGSVVEPHSARNGLLLICHACGHTAFANRRTSVERRSGLERRSPDMLENDGPPVETPEITDWTTER